MTKSFKIQQIIKKFYFTQITRAGTNNLHHSEPVSNSISSKSRN